MFYPLSLLVLSFTGAVIAQLQTDAGCSKPLPQNITPGKSQNISIESGGLERSYRLHIPKSYDAKSSVPLILSFHGRGKNAKQQEELSQFANATVNPNAISVYPQGYMNKKGIRQWQGDPDASLLVNDIDFTIDIITSLQSTYCILPKKIFVAGKSNGGGFVNLLACDSKASSIIAAFAPVSGAYYLTKEGNPPPCNPSRSPLPILEFHGFQDETIPYLGGNNTRNNGVIPLIPVWIGDWATRDGCVPAQNRTKTLCGQGKKEVRRYEWDCKGVEGVVQHYNISNLKHAWPSTTGNDDGDRTTCFEASELIVEFFGKHSLP